MTTPYNKTVTLSDGTEVQIRQSDDSCYEFILVTTEGEEDTFAWDRNEPRDNMDHAGLSERERRRNEALQELWKDI
jgi:hypothetical protein